MLLKVPCLSIPYLHLLWRWAHHAERIEDTEALAYLPWALWWPSGSYPPSCPWTSWNSWRDGTIAQGGAWVNSGWCLSIAGPTFLPGSHTPLPSPYQQEDAGWLLAHLLSSTSTCLLLVKKAGHSLLSSFKRQWKYRIHEEINPEECSSPWAGLGPQSQCLTGDSVNGHFRLFHGIW